MSLILPKNLDDEQIKILWLRQEIIKQLKEKKMTSWDYPDRIYQLFFLLDDDGVYYEINDDNVTTLSEFEECYNVMYKDWPPYFTKFDKDSFYR